MWAYELGLLVKYLAPPVLMYVKALQLHTHEITHQCHVDLNSWGTRQEVSIFRHPAANIRQQD